MPGAGSRIFTGRPGAGILYAYPICSGTDTVDKYLLEILRCPITGQSLNLLGKDRLKKLNAAVAEGSIRYQDGSTVDTPLSAALLTANGTTLYRVDDDIPVMLEDRAIPVEQLQDF